LLLMSETNWMRIFSFIGKFFCLKSLKFGFCYLCYKVLNFLSYVFVTGLVFSKGGLHGKMVFLEQIVLFLQNGTGLISFK
jgi:hypothetical protein